MSFIILVCDLGSVSLPLSPFVPVEQKFFKGNSDFFTLSVCSMFQLQDCSQSGSLEKNVFFFFTITITVVEKQRSLAKSCYNVSKSSGGRRK